MVKQKSRSITPPDSGFNKGRTDGVPLAIALAEVGNELLIVTNVRVKLSHAPLQFCSRRETATLYVKIKQQQAQTLQRIVNIAMPEIMLHPLQGFRDMSSYPGVFFNKCFI